MRVLYHSDALAKRQLFGLGRYASELAESLGDVAPDVTLIRSAAHAEGTAPEAVTVLPGGRKPLAAGWSTVGLPRVEWIAPEFDVLHNVDLAYPVATGKPWLATVHDVGPLTHPHFFSASRPRLKRAAVQSLRRADAVICVSEATADAVVGLLGESVRPRIRIVSEGVSPFFTTPAASGDLNALGLPDAPFFLWTGSKLSPRKNLDRILDAFEAAAPEVPQHLVLAGGVGWDVESVLGRIESSPVADRIHRPGYVTDIQLRALYQKATGFLYISLLEGFGLPILEAMAGGGAVVTSGVSSMPEVAGDAAILVDPLSVDEIADTLVTLGTQEAVVADLRERGRRRAMLFEWSTCAQRIAAVYRELSTSHP